MQVAPGVQALQEALSEDVLADEAEDDEPQVAGGGNFEAGIGQDEGLEFLSQTDALVASLKLQIKFFLVN